MTRATRILSILRSNLFDDTFIRKHVVSKMAFTRNRKLTFARVVGTLVHLCRKSLQIECNLLWDWIGLGDPASKQAFSQARHKIRHTGFQELHEQSVINFYQGNAVGLWRGYRLLGIDGSTCRIPESLELFEYFGRFKAGGVAEKGKQPIKARISEVIDLRLGLVVDAELIQFNSSERTVARQQIPRAIERLRRAGQDKTLVVFDRGYPSRDMFEDMLKSGTDFIFRLPQYYKTTTSALASQNDYVGELYEGIQSLRIVSKKLSTGEKAVLITSLCDENISVEEIFQVYQLRWSGLEEGYKHQKITLELENFSGKSLESVLQDFWCTVLTATLIAIHCAEIEEPRPIIPALGLRVNRSVLMGSLRKDILRVLIGEMTQKEFQDKFTRIASRSKIQVKPGRSFSRDRVDKPKRHHIFRRSC
jgi:hypothetical protein